jgi:hypothetical protein
MEKEIKVSKVFVLQAYENACGAWQRKIEQELPELFGIDWHDMEVGKWYTWDGRPGSAVCYTGDGRGYGVWSGSDWSNHFSTAITSGIWSETSKERITEVLVKRAKELGYTKESTWRSAKYPDTIKNGSYGVFKYRVDGLHADTLYLDGNSIYYQGEWGEIILPDVMTKKEAEEKYKIKIKG